ncbi:TPA: hypothetical protein N0F65_012227 [Lagenidium giganteum]|uniref:PIN domain-containing protein n=1 Tax=Lagenidium giganteum TaxID=4803 RepID=A0AAV2ZFT8_9STRA|nr:TPA: hypothetical protein N0F65_012227 [Lagenidium giganteum]
MGKDKKTRKFAAVKRMISPKDMRINSVKKKVAVANEQKKKEAAPKQIDQIPANLFFKFNTDLGPPYNVLVDTNFINFSIKNKLELVSAMMDCLLAKCTPCITDCVMAELEKLGHKYRVALRLAKDPRFERLPCTHKGTYADDCLVQRVQQHRCYLVATCDRDLKRRIRKVPGVPIMYIANRKYVVERMPEANAAKPKPMPDTANAGQDAPLPNAFKRYGDERQQLLEQYLTETDVLPSLQAFVRRLARRFQAKREIVANPYPALLLHVRRLELSRSLSLRLKKRASDAMEKTELNPLPDASLRVSCVRGGPVVYGPNAVMATMTVAAWHRAMDDLPRVTPPAWLQERDALDEGCRVETFVLCVGLQSMLSNAASVSTGSIHSEHHVFVTSDQVEKAMVVFGRHLIKQMHETSVAPANSSWRLLVPVEIDCHGTIWPLERVQENRNGFLNAVKLALVANGSFAMTIVVDDSAASGALRKHVQRFFLHVTADAGSPTKQPQPSKAKAKTKNVSFMQSSVLAEATDAYFFLSENGAVRCLQRRQEMAVTTAATPPQPQPTTKHVKGTNASATAQQQQVQQQQAALTAKLKSLSGVGARELEELLLGALIEKSASPAEAMAELVVLADTSVLVFLHLADLLEVALQVVNANGKLDQATVLALQSHLNGVGRRIRQVIDAHNPLCSQLLGLEDFVLQRFLAATTQLEVAAGATGASEHKRALERFVRGLELVIHILVAMSRSIAIDYLVLRQPKTLDDTLMVDPSESDLLSMVDVPLALEQVVGERRFPPAIVAEALFAQFLVDSCVDVALEDAVVTALSFRLPPNPFIDIARTIRMFAVRQLVWTAPLVPDTQTFPTNKLQVMDKNEGFAISSDRDVQLSSANASLLTWLDVDRVELLHRWLHEAQLPRVEPYAPSRSSYTVQTRSCLLFFHPVLIFRGRQPEGSAHDAVHMMEHMLVDGRDLAQALQYFSEAVLQDVARICRPGNVRPPWSLLGRPVAVLVDENGALVPTPLDVGRLDASAQLMQDATKAKQTLQLQLSIVRGEMGLFVTKTYTFHFRATPAGGSSAITRFLSPTQQQRVRQFGVFFALDGVGRCLDAAVDPPVPQQLWAPWARDAIAQQDLLLQFELDLVRVEGDRSILSIQAQRLLGHSALPLLLQLVSRFYN